MAVLVKVSESGSFAGHFAAIRLRREGPDAWFELFSESGVPMVSVWCQAQKSDSNERRRLNVRFKALFSGELWSGRQDLAGHHVDANPVRRTGLDPQGSEDNNCQFLTTSSNKDFGN
jgi:hypothetical protein